MPLAVEFGKKYKVVGFDIDDIRINELKTGYDRTNELNEDQNSHILTKLRLQQ